MEFVAGRSLDKVIKPKGIPAAEAVSYARRSPQRLQPRMRWGLCIATSSWPTSSLTTSRR
jgi:hypothetical protein